jgi:hypothetical protein
MEVFVVFVVASSGHVTGQGDTPVVRGVVRGCRCNVDMILCVCMYVCRFVSLYVRNMYVFNTCVYVCIYVPVCM